jgi:hypothetical protein
MIYACRNQSFKGLNIAFWNEVRLDHQTISLPFSSSIWIVERAARGSLDGEFEAKQLVLGQDYPCHPRVDQPVQIADLQLNSEIALVEK